MYTETVPISGIATGQAGNLSAQLRNPLTGATVGSPITNVTDPGSFVQWGGSAELGYNYGFTYYEYDDSSYVVEILLSSVFVQAWLVAPPETYPENFAQLSISVLGKVPATIAAGDIAAGAIDATAIATDAFGSLELAAGAASEIAAATAAQVTTDHGSGSYVRNTEPPTVAAITAQITTDHGAGSYVATGGTGTGDVLVNHDYGGEDSLRVLDSESVPVDNAIIRAYVAADLTAGDIDPAPPTTTTGSDGRWTEPLMLDADTYTMNVYNPSTKRTKSFTLVVT